MNSTFLALDSLFTRYINLYSDQDHKLPSVGFEPPWPSPCLLDKIDNSNSLWRPAERKHYSLFDQLEATLEIQFHPDIKQFYGSFWSNGIAVEREDINFNLIQIWNEEDEEHLKENLLGHAFMKIKSRLPLSFFIGCTFGDDIICLEHESGNIVLEKPGRKAHKILSPSIESFLISLTPTMDTYDR